MSKSVAGITRTSLDCSTSNMCLDNKDISYVVLTWAYLCSFTGALDDFRGVDGSTAKRVY